MLSYRPSERRTKVGTRNQARVWRTAAADHARALRRKSENPAQGR